MKLRRTLLGLLALGTAAALVGCGPGATASNPSTTGTGASGAGAGASGAAGAGAGRDACLIGTWKVNVQDLADQTAAKLPKGGTGKADGDITVAFGDSMTITYADTLTVTSKASSGMAIGVRDVFAGTATSTDYQAASGRLTGSMATNTVTLTTSVIVGGQVQGGSPKPLAGVLDLSKGVTNYTCGGSTLTISSVAVNWHLTKA